MTWHAAFTHSEVASTAQLLALMSRKQLRLLVQWGELIRVERGVYARRESDPALRLASLEMRSRERIVACMQTAAALYGFDTEPDDKLHVLDPGVRLRPTPQLVVHQRHGAPLRRVGDRLATAPAWTAIEIARTLRRPRALAVLDAALHSRSCTAAELVATAAEHKGRRGIVAVRELLPLADGRAESPMESEARLVFIDGGLPTAELQYEIVDRHGKLWRVDFAWPAMGVVAEYDSMQFHATPEALRHDRIKYARLQELGLTTVPLVVDDVRHYPEQLCARLRWHFDRARLAG
ncbi:hypothetical protein ACWDUN_15635 [Mycobacterium sp. NPDC003323]